MATCAFEGNADMYGLGIRIGFYMQWYGAILANWLAPSETVSLRIANTLFITASFIALVIQRNSLEVVEIYILLLLFFGSAFYLLPVLLWRLLTCFNPLYDPTRFPRAKPPGNLFNFLYTLLIIAVFSFTIWFWAARVPTLSGQHCVQSGFMFVEIRLDSYGFRVFHLVLGALLIVLLATLLMLHFFHGDSNTESLPENLKNRKRVPIFRHIDAAAKLAVAAVVNVAVEKSIVWNNIQGVQSADSAGQTIPLVIGAAAVIRVFYVYFFEGKNNSHGGATHEHALPTQSYNGMTTLDNLAQYPAARPDSQDYDGMAARYQPAANQLYASDRYRADGYDGMAATHMLPPQQVAPDTHRTEGYDGIAGRYTMPSASAQAPETHRTEGYDGMAGHHMMPGQSAPAPDRNRTEGYDGMAARYAVAVQEYRPVRDD